MTGSPSSCADAARVTRKRNAVGCHACRYWQPYGGPREHAPIGACKLDYWQRVAQKGGKRPTVGKSMRPEHYVCDEYDQALPRAK